MTRHPDPDGAVRDAVQANPGRTVSWLARHLSLPPSLVSGITYTLTERGLIRTVTYPNPKHGNQTRVFYPLAPAPTSDPGGQS